MKSFTEMDVSRPLLKADRSKLFYRKFVELNISNLTNSFKAKLIMKLSWISEEILEMPAHFKIILVIRTFCYLSTVITINIKVTTWWWNYFTLSKSVQFIGVGFITHNYMYTVLHVSVYCYVAMSVPWASTGPVLLLYFAQSSYM